MFVPCYRLFPLTVVWLLFSCATGDQSGSVAKDRIASCLDGGGVGSAGYYEPFDTPGDDWTAARHGFESNASNMVPENISVANSILTMRTTVNDNPDLPRKYNGAGMGSTADYLYGYFEVRMKPDIKSGTVGSFFLMDRWKPENWGRQEIDIEFTGNKMTSMQMTTHQFQNGGADHQFSATTKELGFDVSEDFHNYGILWTEDRVSWYVDGEWFHTEELYVPQVPLQMRLNHWVGDQGYPYMRDWLGRLHDRDLPSTVEYDWIRFVPLEDFRAGKCGKPE